MMPGSFRFKKIAWVIASVTFLGGVGVVKPEIIQKIGCEALDWGPGFLLAILMLYGLYLLANSVGLKIIAGLEKPSDALTKQAEALIRQSGSMDKLTDSLQEYVARDRSEHREILILLKMIANKLTRLEEDNDGPKEGTI